MKRYFPALIAAAMVLGVLTGFLINSDLPPDQAKAAAAGLSIITDLFLRLIKMIIAPLVFSTLVAGIAHMEDSAAIGRVAAWLALVIVLLQFALVLARYAFGLCSIWLTETVSSST